MKEPGQTRSSRDRSASEGQRRQKVYAEAFAKLAPGTSVIIDVASGEYVTAPDWHQARAAFRQRFSEPGRTSISFDVDRPIFLGGGLWRK